MTLITRHVVAQLIEGGHGVIGAPPLGRYEQAAIIAVGVMPPCLFHAITGMGGLHGLEEYPSFICKELKVAGHDQTYSPLSRTKACGKDGLIPELECIIVESTRFSI